MHWEWDPYNIFSSNKKRLNVSERKFSAHKDVVKTLHEYPKTNLTSLDQYVKLLALPTVDWWRISEFKPEWEIPVISVSIYEWADTHSEKRNNNVSIKTLLLVSDKKRNGSDSVYDWRYIDLDKDMTFEMKCDLRLYNQEHPERDNGCNHILKNVNVTLKLNTQIPPKIDWQWCCETNRDIVSPSQLNWKRVVIYHNQKWELGYLNDRKDWTYSNINLQHFWMRIE